MSENPFSGEPSCPNCDNTNPSNFVAKFNGQQLGEENAFTFLLSEDETQATISIDCQNCGGETARSVVNIER